MASFKDPIDQMKELEQTSRNYDDSTQQLLASTQAYNTNVETSVKQNQLNKFHNDRLNKQLGKLKELESNIINKDRLIEQTNLLNENNNRNLNTLYISVFLASFLFLCIILYSIGYMNERLLGIFFSLIVLIFTCIILYTYNIFHFADIANFLDNRRNLRLQESIKNTGRRIQQNLQERIYGDKQDWTDSNCDCPETEDIYTDEENIAIDIKPGYFYYDKNAPKQNITPSGGQEINVSKNPDKEIYDKIKWVDHDTKTSDVDAEDYNYNINPNNNDIYKSGNLVNDSTYTINL